MLYIHKLLIRTCVGKEYYDDLADIKSASVKNGAKTHEIKMGLAFNKPVEEALDN
jgi:hypothetical protein